ncbi:MAG: hypothetical protein NZ789_16700, partial [Pseudomonadales bacterium]|nr:hypothetical protein [Pseudomonadales bacterium]
CTLRTFSHAGLCCLTRSAGLPLSQRDTEKNFLEAVKWYRLAAEQGDVLAANRLAWLLATCPLEAVCNGHVALEFAKLAVSVDDSATNLDSMAAA